MEAIIRLIERDNDVAYYELILPSVGSKIVTYSIRDSVILRAPEEDVLHKLLQDFAERMGVNILDLRVRYEK